MTQNVKADWKVEKAGKHWIASGTAFGEPAFGRFKTKWEAEKHARTLNECAKESEAESAKILAERNARAAELRAARSEKFARQPKMF